MKLHILLAMVLVQGIALNSSAYSAELTRVRYLMGTLCEISVVAGTDDKANLAITSAFEEIARLESILSLYLPDSQVSKLRDSPTGKRHSLSPDLFEILSASNQISEETDGAFDVTMASAGYRSFKMNLKSRSLVFKKRDLLMDFGGIGKGFALDKAAALLHTMNVSWAKLNFGGQILILGQNPQNGPYLVELSNPADPGTTIFMLSLSSGSVATSSQFDRPGHIVDPRTGHPVPFQGSVTVIAPTATLADALATALVVLGPEKGIRVMETTYADSAAFFLLPDGPNWTVAATSNSRPYFFKDSDDAVIPLIFN